MTATTETLYQYHIREWREFATQQWEECKGESWDEGEEPDLEEYIEDLAPTYWASFEDEASQNHFDGHQLINYSAGVFCGEVEEIVGETRINEVTWYNDDNQEYIKEVDTVCVALMAANADLYADECEAEVKRQIAKMIEAGEFESNLELAAMLQLNPSEFLAGLITSEMIKDHPELLEVLAQWNRSLTIEETIDFFNESNFGTVSVILETHGIA